MTDYLPYNPGSLPTMPAPIADEVLEFTVQGWPPWKDTSASIRNVAHRNRAAFVRLRAAAAAAMNGRAWSSGPIGLDVIIRGPAHIRKRSLVDYVAGIEDTIDGSHGYTFTYLPICFEDDCQVCEGRASFVEASEPTYTVTIRFLSNGPEGLRVSRPPTTKPGGSAP